MSLLMISENVKLAREYALLGNYDSAMVYYQGVLDQMNKYLYSVKDTYLQQKWQQVRLVTAVCFSGLKYSDLNRYCFAAMHKDCIIYYTDLYTVLLKTACHIHHRQYDGFYSIILIFGI